jgi:hypothetical protein
MARLKRSIAQEEIKSVTFHLRASVHDKLMALVGPSGSKVGTFEAMTEYLFARRLRNIAKIANRMEDLSLNDPK